eukprot:COSAG04_NODE_162_length_21964_cov_8.739721_6_plen_312_part_00
MDSRWAPVLAVWSAAGCIGLGAACLRAGPSGSSQPHKGDDGGVVKEDEEGLPRRPRVTFSPSFEYREIPPAQPPPPATISPAVRLAIAAAKAAEQQAAPAPPASTAAHGPLQSLPILRLDGSRVAPRELEGKIVLLYFSGAWCPPCRRFTPLLKDFYSKQQERCEGEDSAQVEVVFVSSDHSAEQMMDYMRESHGPWLRLDYAQRVTQQQLCQRFQVRTIPKLVAVNWPSGEVISMNGRGEVAEMEAERCLRGWRESKRRMDCKQEALRRAVLQQQPESDALGRDEPWSDEGAQTTRRYLSDRGGGRGVPR